MYIRFESTIPDADARCNQGVFTTACDVWYDRSDLAGMWQVKEIRRLLDWFNLNLSTPKRLHYRPHQKAEISGVCWFRASSERYISDTRYLAWLLEDLGYLIVERHSRTPGRILWRDCHQIVASNQL